ncbi:hypothetical protein [Acidovorax sp. NCPPB 3576]|uniref:hypothetical protein n=1 Tax=Acidovorax sp. NCPPB 3576 TaxID=2940488 RepID=UPI00234BA6A6|nr:hypothetical protein [Acidovorax sp. NCPPB 3576]WCM86778.1 hypothetical protein M5C98_15500 [Acidovorax sp. NCPPB 3576]
MIEREAMEKITNFLSLDELTAHLFVESRASFLQLTIDARNTDRLQQRRALSSSKHPQRERF